MIIDYNKIFPNDLKTIVSEDTLNNIKQIAKNQESYIKNRYSGIDTAGKSKKGEEFAYTNAKNSKKSAIEKALIAENIAFNDEDFAKVISKSNYYKEYLESYLKILNYLKSKYTIDGLKSLNNDDKKLKENAEKITKSLECFLARYYGHISPNIIINKISEILSFKPYLIDNKVEKVINNPEYNFKKTLSTSSEIEYVYYDVTKENGNTTVICKVYCSCNNIITKNIIELIKKLECIKDNFTAKNIYFDYYIMTLEEANEETKPKTCIYRKNGK